MPWRSTIRGVIVARSTDDIVLLEGLAATCWRLLDRDEPEADFWRTVRRDHPAVNRNMVDEALTLMEQERLLQS